MSTVPTNSPAPHSPSDDAVPYLRIHNGSDDSGWDALAVQFDTAGRGSIEVCSMDLDEPDGPVGIDPYRPTGQTLTVDQARGWIVALRAAVDLAERVNRGEEHLGG